MEAKVDAASSRKIHRSRKKINRAKDIVGYDIQCAFLLSTSASQEEFGVGAFTKTPAELGRRQYPRVVRSSSNAGSEKGIFEKFRSVRASSGG